MKEMWFEINFHFYHLQAVFATGTLALGVHMPCRSVIFAGDSPFLTPIQYRQVRGILVLLLVVQTRLAILYSSCVNGEDS